MDNANVNKRLLWGLYAAWSIPIANFLMHPSYDPQTWPVWLAMGVTLSICLADGRFCALALPFVAMFSPLAGTSRFMNLLPSEIFLVYCGFSWFCIVIARKNRVEHKLFPGDAYLLLMALIALFSYIQSFEYVALLPSFLNWIALFVVFAVTREAARSTDLMGVYFLSLLVVAGYASALIVTSFFNYIVLAYFLGDAEKIDYSHIRESSEYYFRASYFYTNILYVLGAAAIASIVSAFSNEKPIYKFLSSGLLIAILATLFIMFSKTALFALAVSLLILIRFATDKSSRQHIGILQYVLGYGLSVFLLLFGVMVVETLDLTGGTKSFDLRLDVISSSFHVLLRSPERLFFGFGPDASTRLSNEAVYLAHQSALGTEGAIDSAYMAFFFDYGLVFLVLFLMFGVHTLWRLLRLIRGNRQPRSVLINLLGVIVFFYIAAGAQVIGTSKVAWVIFQVFALAGICLREKSLIDGKSVDHGKVDRAISG